MSLLAGAISLRGHGARDPSITRPLTAGLSRQGDPVETFGDDRLFLAKVDFGTFRDPVFVREPLVATVTGEPFYQPLPGRRHRRAEDVARLAPRLAARDLRALLDCAGTFSIVVYEPASGRVLISTDRLGARAVYLFRDWEFLFFASSVRILESLRRVPRRMDGRAMAEIICFGYPLGDRTEFADVKNLRGGHVVVVDGGSVQQRRYHGWSDIPPCNMSRDEFLDESYRTFVDAVETRAARDGVAVSYLSGGLDSRVIVSSLRQLGKATHTMTFEYPHLRDGVIARRFAAAVGASHTSIPVGYAADGRWLQAEQPSRTCYSPPVPSYPQVVFSGDGGSVGLGFVFVTNEIVRAMRGGRPNDAVAMYLTDKVIPNRLMKKQVCAALRHAPARGVREELAAAGARDPAKDFHIFLLDNDQRRHLHYIYEDLDLFRVELLLPFLDGRWLDLIASAPVDWFLYHSFYHDFLARFPEPASTIPWQSYPGHLPCPIQEPGLERTQWELTRKERLLTTRSSLRRCSRTLFTWSRFPAPILRRPPVLAAFALHATGIKDFAHIWTTYERVQTIHARSAEIVLESMPPEDAADTNHASAAVIT